LTLVTSVPVLPIAVWGSQHVWQRDGAKSLQFGRPIWLKAGRPLHFSEHGDDSGPQTLRAVTRAIMDELTRLVMHLRSRYPARWS
jgi:1-acyl-sn-glycerol-3-phosphate acyltransferase